MASGKSTAGRKMASLLQWSFADIDRLVEENEDSSISDIFTGKGEDYFRKAESEVLHSLSLRSRMVVSCGGGTPCSTGNMEVMRATGVVVYLKLPADEITDRLQKSKTVRPLMRGLNREEMMARVEEMLEGRSCWYEMADLVVDGQKETIEEITARVAGLVRDKGAFL